MGHNWATLAVVRCHIRFCRGVSQFPINPDYRALLWSICATKDNVTQRGRTGKVRTHNPLVVGSSPTGPTILLVTCLGLWLLCFVLVEAGQFEEKWFEFPVVFILL